MASACSSYIIQRSPDAFGEQQDDYNTECLKAVKQTAKHLRKAIDKGKDLKKVFTETLITLAAWRWKVAVKHKTPDSHDFGARCDDPKFSDLIFRRTALTERYQEYGKLVLDHIHSALKTMSYTPLQFFETSKRFVCETVFGRASYIDYEIVTQKEAAQLYRIISQETYEVICTAIKRTRPPGDFSGLWFNDLVTDFKAMKKLKIHSEEIYEKIKRVYLFKNIDNSHEKIKKTDFVLATHYLEVNGKMVPTSQFLTWLNCDGKTDPVDRMIGSSTVELIHQDVFLIPPMLEEAGKLFERVLLWEGTELGALKESMILWSKVFDSSIPFKRGTAAISEIFQRAMYWVHGFELRYKPETMVNLEMLIKPLPQVVKSYDSMIELIPLI